MRVAAVADLHGFLPETPECDILIVAGDVTPVRDHSRGRQRAWLTGPLSDWLTTRPCREVVGIAGNHDLLLEEDEELGYTLPWTYLCGESAVVMGVHIWGSPLANQFMDWAFMAEEDELRRRWQAMPKGADVVVTHGPAYGACDSTVAGLNVGSTSLRDRIVEVAPALHVCGHIHEAYGISLIGTTVAANASLVNERYDMVNRPHVFEIETGGDGVRAVPQT